MFDLRIAPDDGEPFDVKAGMRDVVMWEKTHRGRSLSQLGDGGLSAGMVYELAFSACQRQQLIPREMTEKQFTDTHEIDVETPEQSAARQRAEDLKARILAGVVEPPTVAGVLTDEPDEPDEPFDGFTPHHAADESDPTRPEV